MPGIAALVTQMPREKAMEQLSKMVESLRHEDFYTTGTWIDEESGVYVGWTAHQGSFCDRMPLRNERGDVVLIFAGEEFPEPATPVSLRSRGHEFESAGPSYLVHLYEDDPEFPARLNGRFHGLLFDRRRGSALLFNDRYGMHRVYFHECRDGIYFAAEAKAILAVRRELRELDPTGIGEFISCGCVLEDRTLFKGIHALPPASAWLLRHGSVAQKRTYFRPKEWEQQEALDADSYYASLRQVLAENLPRYLGGRQRIGVSLTGGLDTRIIMAWQRAAPGCLPCYTFGGMYRECRDVTVARQVAQLCGQPHEIIRVGEEFLSGFAQYAERTVYLADGCVDVSRASDLYLSTKAREFAPVRMTGNYGGEVLPRVRAFKPEGFLPGLLDSEVMRAIQQASKTYSYLIQEHPVSFAVFKQGPWHHYGPLMLEQTQLTMRSPYLDNDFVRTVFRAPRSTLMSEDVSLQLIADGNADQLRIETDRGVAGERGRLLSTFSRGLHEFFFKMEYRYDIGMPHWMARVDRATSPLHLDRMFLGRHKILHFRVWYRDTLAAYIREILLDRQSLTRPYIDGKKLERIVWDHVRGDRNYTTPIHKALSLELLHRIFVDGGGANTMYSPSLQDKIPVAAVH